MRVHDVDKLFRELSKRNHTDGVESEPEPSSGSRGADAGVEFVHLHEREHEVAKEEVVPRLTVAAHPFEAAGEGCIRVTGETNQH